MNNNYYVPMPPSPSEQKAKRNLHICIGLIIALLAILLFLFVSGTLVTRSTMITNMEMRYTEGKEEGYDKGREEGYSQGKTAGYDEGYTEGQDNGYIEGVSDTTQIYEDKIAILMAKLEEPYPATGTILYHSEASRYAPLTINNPTSEPYFFKIYMDNPQKTEVLSFFVSPQSTADVDVALGDFRIKFAYASAGSKWYGDKMLFGDNTQTAQYPDIFSFYTEGDSYMGYTLNLAQVYNGNLSHEPLPLADF